MGRSEGSGALPSEFFISARHQAICVSMATRYSRNSDLQVEGRPHSAVEPELDQHRSTRCETLRSLSSWGHVEGECGATEFAQLAAPFAREMATTGRSCRSY